MAQLIGKQKMIPLLRIAFIRQIERGGGTYCGGPLRPADAVTFALRKFVSRINRPVYKDEFLFLAERYSKMSSGNWHRTFKAFESEAYNSYGRVLASKETKNTNSYVYFDVGYANGTEIYYGESDGSFCLLSDKNEIIAAARKYEEYVLSGLKCQYRHLSKYTKKTTRVAFCKSCKKCRKVSNYEHADNCKACIKKLAFYKDAKNESVEVNRLLNKLRKAIKNESERLKKETCECNV